MSTPNRSPSPMLTRPNPNPNPNSRSHQERDGITPARKSFSGYPLGKPSIVSQPRSFLPNTPANSPAEYARNSFSRDYEQKENERDHHNLKPIVKPRSPSISKGSKNFMSPTISAASKINPSPRKKVLGERNEAIRTSASLSDGKFQFFSSSSLEFSDENDPKSNTENPTAENKLPEKIAAESILQERKIGSEPDLVVLSPEVPSNTPKFSDDQSLPLSETPKIEAESNLGLDVKNSSCSSPTVIAPLDADPSLPPYDPKTNFLSPRPQFLCYRPNPRIESYINNGLRLEDEFTSESCSETENCEETESEDQGDSSSSSSSSLETSLQEKPPCSESKPTETQEVQEALEGELEHRPHFFKKWKTLAFVVVFLFGLISLSVTYNPSLMSANYREETVLKAYNDPHVVLDLAKENFNALFQDVKLWSAYSVDHLYQMIHGIREVNTYGPLPYSNLTVWQEEADYVVGEFELGTLFERREDYVVEDFELSSIVDEEEDIEEEIEDTNAENFSELQSQIEELDSPVEETDLDEVEESSLLPPVVDAEDLKVERSEIVETEIQEPKSSQEETDITADLHDEYPANVDETEIQEKHIQDENHITADIQEEFNVKAQDSSSPLSPEVLTPSEPVGEDDQSSLNNVEIKEMRNEEVKIDSEKVVPEAKPRSIQLPSSSSEGSLAPIITTVILAVLLMAIAGFMYMKPKKTAAPISAQSAMEKSVANEKEPSISQSIGQVEVDMMSEPCASEMSSFQKTTSYSKRSARKGFDEAQSQSTERRPKRDSKRESLASSSSEYTMCSYGSFTTYSILPSKKGDEEMVTPVRRSSRIRNHQVTSP